MSNRRIWILLLVLWIGLPLVSFSQRNCKDLPAKFSTYSQALYEVRNAKFSYSDQLNTSGSSFITGARYFSCDGKSGYLIIGLNNKDYIHQGLPKQIWLSFKKAESLGSFYSKNIRYRYRLSVVQ